MSTTNITNEVVRMTFEGDDFEKRISKSLSALQKLKEHLSFHKSASEAEDNMNIITRSLETMANKAESIWARVTDKIKEGISGKIMGALREVEDMTVNQVMKGWDKYAEKTNAVATLVGQGYNMKEVNKQMEILNRYTDETSYDFTSMVQSIGKFTASGQSLEDANLAMQGIANWAALSGANATKASSAMYQLSQAMGKGALKYDDYKSVQNLGMDTEEFRKQAIDAAVALGTLRDNFDGTYTVISDTGEAIEKYTFTIQSFTNDLSEGKWFTSDVMMKTFSKYASAIENINREIDKGEVSLASEAIERLEERNAEVKSKFAEMVKDLNWSEEQTQAALLKWSQVEKVNEKSIEDYLKFNENATREEAKAALQKKYTDAVQEYADTFHVSLEQARKDIKEWNKYTDEFGLKAYKAGQEARTFKDAIDSVKDAASTQWMKVWESLFGDYETAKKTWTAFTNYLYGILVEWLEGVNKSLKKWVKKGGRDILMKAFSKLGDVIQIVRDGITEINQALFGKLTSNKLLKTTEKIYDVTRRIKNLFLDIQRSDFLENLVLVITRVRTTISRLFGSLKTAFDNVFGIPEQDRSKRLVKFLNSITGFFNRLTRALRMTKQNAADLTRFFTGALSMSKTALKLIGTVITSLVKGLFPSTKGFFKTLKEAKNNAFAFLGDAGDKLKELSDKIENSGILTTISENMEKFGETLRTKVWPKVQKVLTAIGGGVKVVGGVILEIGKKIFSQFKKVPIEKTVTLFDKLKERMRPLGRAVKKLGEAFKDGFGAMFDSMKKFNEDDERTIFQRILDGLVAGFKAFKERLTEAWSAFKEVINEITTSDFFQGFVSFIKSVWSGIKMIFTDFVMPVLKYIWEVIKGPTKKILDMLREGRVKEVLELVKSAFQIGALARVMAFLKTFMAFFKDAKLATIIASIANVFDNMAGMFKQFAGVGKDARKAIKAWKNERVANTILKIVVAIGLVIGLVYALSYISPQRAAKMWDAFKFVLAGLAVIVGMMIAVSIVAKRGSASLWGLAAVFASVTLCIILVSKVVKIMGEQLKNNTSTMIVGFIGIIVLMIAVVGAMASLLILANGGNAYGNAAGFKLLGLAATMLAMGLAIAIIAGSMKKIGSLDAKDFWQALAGVILMITTLAAATWLLNVQKSQKGTLMLIGLILVIRYMLVPLLRSLANESFDMGKALSMVFLPLIGFGVYIFAMNKVLSQTGALKNMVIGVLALAGVMYVISETLLPAMTKAIAAAGGNGYNLIGASLAILLTLAGFVAVFAMFQYIDWGSILKGAVGIVVGCAAMAAVLYMMTEAFKALPGSSGGDFAAAGLGLAATLILLAGAMSLLGAFAPSALLGATSLLVLAGAVALLTQSIIAFKKYVLGDDSVGELVGSVDSIGTAFNQNGVSTKSGGGIKDKILAKNIPLDKGAKSSVSNRSKSIATEYSKSFAKNMNNTKAKEAQIKAGENLAKNTSAGLDTYNAEEILKNSGIDTTDLISQGMNGYDAESILKDAGVDTSSLLKDGLGSKDAQKLLEEAGSGAVVDLSSGISGVASQEEINNASTDLVNQLIGNSGLGSTENTDALSNGGENVLSSLVSGFTSEGGVAEIANGSDSVASLLTGGNGLGGINLSGTGNNVIGSFLSGMQNGSFMTNSLSTVMDEIGKRVHAALVKSVETTWNLPTWIHDQLFGTDFLNTGKNDRRVSEVKKIIDENILSIKRQYEAAVKNDQIDTGFRNSIDTLYYNSSEMIDKYGVASLNEYGDEWREILNYIESSLNTLEQRYPEVMMIPGEAGLILGRLREQMEKEQEATQEAAQKRADAMLYGLQNSGMTLFDKRDPSKEMAEVWIGDANKWEKELYDEMNNMGENAAKGFANGLGDAGVKLGDEFANGFMKTITDSDHLDEHSPSLFGSDCGENFVYGFADGMVAAFKYLDSVLNLMQAKLVAYTAQAMLNVQTLLKSERLEMSIVPVIDLDNMEYILSGMRFDKDGNLSANTSYGLSKNVTSPSAPAANSNDMSKGIIATLNQILGRINGLDVGGTEVNVYNSSDIDTVIEKINRKSKQQGYSVIK